MIYLYALDKKLLSVSQRFTHEEIKGILENNKITEEQLVNEIQKQLYIKFAQSVAGNIRTVVTTNDKEVMYSIKGYILSELNIKELIREVLEMTQEERQEYLEEIKTIPTVNGKENKS